jgi:carboxypeptidase C (cathepsin A)
MKKVYFLLICLYVSSFTCYAQSKDSVKTDSKTVVNKKTFTIAGKAMSFTVETGYMAWKDDKDEQKANVFYTSYIKEGETEGKRPLTFAFNGGPGSSSLWLHIGCLGPKRIVMDETGNAPAPPYELTNNESSWLDMTDIVFIDPVGTGFSRPTKGEKEAQFYGYKNDVSSVGEFVRLFLNKQKRWASPKYIVGESYGTSRAAGLSKYLIDEHGIYLNGIVLISSTLDFETFREFENNDLAYLSYLPSITASSFYHKKLTPALEKDLQTSLAKVESFIYNSYANALYKGILLTQPEKDKIADSLSYYTGLSKAYILKSNLRIPSWRYRKALLNDSSKSIGRFDSRLLMPETDNLDDDCANDASFTKIRAAFSTSINYYLRSELKYNNDLPYNIIGNVSPWEYANGKYLNVMPDITEAMIQNPDMKVWIASGYYDLATPFFGATYAINHANIPTSLRKNILSTYYEAGHMMYLYKPCLEKLKKDALQFYTK